MTQVRLVVLLTALLAAAAPDLSAQQGPEKGTYQIAPGDVLDVVVWRNKELTLTVMVRPDGFISLPLLGDVRANGLTPVELQVKLEAGLAKTVTAPIVNVIVAKIAGFRVSILGKVRQPGRYDVDTGATALDVLALAGGPNDYANAAGMYLLRQTAAGTYEEIAVRYSTSQEGKARTNVVVKPGDILIVP